MERSAIRGCRIPRHRPRIALRSMRATQGGPHTEQGWVATSRAREIVRWQPPLPGGMIVAGRGRRAARARALGQRGKAMRSNRLAKLAGAAALGMLALF